MRKGACETAVGKNTKLLNFLEKIQQFGMLTIESFRAIADIVKWREKRQKLSFLLMRIIV